MGYPSEEGEILDAEIACDFDLFARIDAERHHAVDIARLKARIIERGLHALASQLELGSSRLLRELSLADPRNRRLASQ